MNLHSDYLGKGEALQVLCHKVAGSVKLFHKVFFLTESGALRIFRVNRIEPPCHKFDEGPLRSSSHWLAALFALYFWL